MRELPVRERARPGRVEGIGYRAELDSRRGHHVLDPSDDVAVAALTHLGEVARVPALVGEPPEIDTL